MLTRNLLSYTLQKRAVKLFSYHGYRRNKSHVCIVGSGPAGFYAAQQLLKGNSNIHVDIYEKLPVPFGLVRYGVAPDHPEVKLEKATVLMFKSPTFQNALDKILSHQDYTEDEIRRVENMKDCTIISSAVFEENLRYNDHLGVIHVGAGNVINTFTQTAKNPRCSFLGNVTVGKDISLSELQKYYTAVILAYGAEDDRLLGIPGEDLKNVVGARNFVGWYNGLPQDSDLNIDLDVDTVLVLGQGNVALDVARILLTPVDILAKTDITEHSLEALRKSCVKRVLLVGRRGPLQVAFTIKELREMTKIPGCRHDLIKSDFKGLEGVIKDLPRPRRRLTELMYNTAMQDQAADETSQREWGLRFRLSPLEILGHNSKVSGVKFGVNKMEGDKAILTDQTETIQCGLVLRSIGYRGNPLDSTLPFDHGGGVIQNKNGRVKGIPGLYSTGWISRGPTGVILTTMTDGFDVGKTVLKDIETGAIDGSSQRDCAIQTLQDKGVKVVSFEDWLRIDIAETVAGDLKNKPREKIVDVQKMLDVLT